MIKYLWLILALLLISNLGFGQPSIPTIWATQATYETITAEDELHPALILSDKRYVEFVEEDFQIFRRLTNYKKIHLNNDLATSEYRYVYVPLNISRNLLDLKIRTVQSDGRVISTKYEGNRSIGACPWGGTCEMFEAKGAIPGAQIEYMYVYLDQYWSYGREVFQQELPVKSMDFRIFHPDNMSFMTKAYNSPKSGNDPSIQTFQIDPYIPEHYAVPQADRFRIDYKIINRNMGATNNWIPIVGEIVDNLIDTTTSVYFDQFVLGINRYAQEEDQIKAIETVIKNSFTIVNEPDLRLVEVDSVLKYRRTNALGISRLMLKSLKHFGINPEIVATCDRNLAQFDPDFPTYLNVKEILFYFNKWEKFISPYAMEYKLGFAPPQLAANQGLYIYYDEQRNELRSRMDQIPIASADDNRLGVTTRFHINEDWNVLNLHKVNWYQGYRAYNLRGAIRQQGKHILSDLVRAEIEETKVDSIWVVNDDLESNYENEVLEIHSKLQSNSLFEKNGEAYSLSIGKVLGPQTELTDPGFRSNPIELESPLSYQHTFLVDVPKGYKAVNLDAFVIDRILDVEGDVIASFHSEFEVSDQKITIKVSEDYHEVSISKKHYREFKEVVNAAAQFYQLKLIFKKG